MTRKEAVRILCAHESALHAAGDPPGVVRFAGAGRSGEDSDIDVVVDIDPGRVFSLIDLADLRLYLCDLFGRETDVVIRGDLRPHFRDRIAADEVAVF